MKALYIFCIILLISVAFGHYGHHGKHGGSKEGHNERQKLADPRHSCSYVNTQHDRIDLYLLTQHYNGADLSHYDPKTRSTIYFSPCGTPSACPQNSSVCVLADGKMTSYGSIHSSQSAFISSGNPKDSGNLEVISGKGELCNNGVPRKTIITYTCAHLDAISESFGNYRSYPPISSVVIEPCQAYITIESPFVCPVDAFCSSIHSSKDCDDQQVCGWMFGKCLIEPEVFGAELGLLLFILIGVGLLCMCCICGLCLYMFVKKANKSEKKMTDAKLAKKMEKKNKKSMKKKETKARKVSQKKKSTKGDSIEMDSFSMPYELIPGGYISVEEHTVETV